MIVLTSYEFQFDFKMSLNDGSCSQESTKSQDSFDWREFDDCLDLDQPPIYSSPKYNLPITQYSTQLFLSKSTQSSGTTKTQSSFDNEFEFTQNSGHMQSQMTQQAMEPPKMMSTHQFNFPMNEQTNSDVDSGVACSQNSYFSHMKKSNFEFAAQRLFASQSTNSQSDGAYKLTSQLTASMNFKTNRMVFSCDADRTTSDDGADFSQSNSVTADCDDSIQPINSPLDHSFISIDPKIQPILNLFSEVKSQHSDYAFVFALAGHMCSDIYPKHTHITLKTALLLSILSCDV